MFKIGGLISVLFFLFHLNWGLNYFRQPVHKTLNFEKEKYTTNELVDFTEKLIVKINRFQMIFMSTVLKKYLSISSSSAHPPRCLCMRAIPAAVGWISTRTAAWGRSAR